MMMSIELGKSSFSKIFAHDKLAFSVMTFVILGCSVAVSALHEEHGVGCGYVCECDGMNVRELAQRAKDVLGCRVVRFSGGEREISRVGVCSGSGGSFLADAAEKTLSGAFDR